MPNMLIIQKQSYTPYRCGIVYMCLPSTHLQFKLLKRVKHNMVKKY